MLTGKIALITGVSGGIGAATSQLFQENNCIVIGIDVNHPIEPNTSSFIFYQCNLADMSQIKNLVGNVLSEVKIDILVNCAGITADALTLNMTEEQFDNVVSINLKAVWYLTKLISQQMIETQSGNIINISSVVGEYGNIGQSNYSATKAALIGLTKTWAKEFTRHGENIRVNAVAPGYTLTDMVKAVPDKLLKKFESQTMLGRLAQPREIANTILFLACDMSSYITGTIIDVNGGMRL